MANIKNLHTGRLTVAGVPIQPGRTVRIENWDAVKAAGLAKTLLDLNAIEVVAEAEPEPEPEPKTKGKAA